jgi:signal transduction histidine kinase
LLEGGQLLNLSGAQSLFKYQSGRVIALGRVMLASLFLLSIALDDSQPALDPARTYAMLLVYLLFALALATATWRNWWLDARLAAPAHVFDMVVFTGIVFSTNGYTSPFFLFFILPLLSAAIRWSWRETMITATALILLYLTAGLLVAGIHAFELERFIVRSGHLLILSAVLIWFGVHQQFSRIFFNVDEIEREMNREEDPLRQALTLAMEAAGAKSGALLLAGQRNRKVAGLRVSDGVARPLKFDRPFLSRAATVVLFRLRGDRALTRRRNSWYHFAPASRLLDVDALRDLGAREGFVAEVRFRRDLGRLILWDMAELSVDFLDLGADLGRAAGVVIDREALVSAMEEGAAAKTRLSLARDVHDSVLQFLAGAAFRVEAIIRGSAPGTQSEADLKELKRLLIEEQGEIRTLVSALRRDREFELAEAVEELKGLARRLEQQWSIDCQVNAGNVEASIPIQLQLDLQQLLREAVANAVRHGSASRVHVDVGVDEDRLRLEIKDNGRGFGPANGSPVEPWSLKERVARAHGSLSLRCEEGSTNLLITLPLTGPTE